MQLQKQCRFDAIIAYPPAEGLLHKMQRISNQQRFDGESVLREAIELIRLILNHVLQDLSMEMNRRVDAGTHPNPVWTGFGWATSQNK